jgi:hypothetical protein
VAVATAECLPVASATCTGLTSSTTAADGTLTKIQNNCFSDGTKDLEVDTYAPGASTPSRNIQILRNGATCSTIQETSSYSVDAAGNRTDTDTQVIDDATGNLLATVITTTMRMGNFSNRTQTITCAGQSPEPLVQSCLFGSIFSCAAGSCM